MTRIGRAALKHCSLSLVGKLSRVSSGTLSSMYLALRSVILPQRYIFFLKLLYRGLIFFYFGRKITKFSQQCQENFSPNSVHFQSKLGKTHFSAIFACQLRRCSRYSRWVISTSSATRSHVIFVVSEWASDIR